MLWTRPRQKAGLGKASMVERALLFDFDGVLVESLDIYAEAVSRCLERIGSPIVKSREDFLALFDGNFYESLAGRGVDLEAFHEAGRDVFSRLDYAAMKPYEGIGEVLAALSKDCLLALVSSNGFRTIRAVLDPWGLTGHFREILGSDSGLSKKDKIVHLLKKYDLPASRAFYIGDTVGDIREAKAAAVRSVAVTWGWHDRRRLEAARPDFLVESPRGLLALARTELSQKDPPLS